MGKFLEMRIKAPKFKGILGFPNPLVTQLRAVKPTEKCFGSSNNLGL